MPKNDCPLPPDDKWFLDQNVRSSVFVADFINATSQSLFYGTVGARVYEKDPNTPATVIDVDDAWNVDVHINVAGLIPTLWCGWWCISLCCESLCGDTDYRFPHENQASIHIKRPTPKDGYFPRNDCCCWLIPVDPCCGITDCTITVQPNTIAESICGGPYEITLVVTFLTSCQIKDGDPNDPKNYRPGGIASSVELPLLTFYDDEGGTRPSTRFDKVRFGDIVRDTSGALIAHFGLGVDVVGTVHDVNGSVTVEQHPVPQAPGPYLRLSEADRASLIRALDTFIEANSSANPLWKQLLAELKR